MKVKRFLKNPQNLYNYLFFLRSPIVCAASFQLLFLYHDHKRLVTQAVNFKNGFSTKVLNRLVYYRTRYNMINTKIYNNGSRSLIDNLMLTLLFMRRLFN